MSILTTKMKGFTFHGPYKVPWPPELGPEPEREPKNAVFEVVGVDRERGVITVRRIK